MGQLMLNSIGVEMLNSRFTRILNSTVDIVLNPVCIAGLPPVIFEFACESSTADVPGNKFPVIPFQIVAQDLCGWAVTAH